MYVVTVSDCVMVRYTRCKLLVSLVQPVHQIMDAFKASAQLVLKGTQVCPCRLP